MRNELWPVSCSLGNVIKYLVILVLLPALVDRCGIARYVFSCPE